MFMGVCGAHFDEPQNCLVVSVYKLLDVGILSIAGKRVLGKVVPTLKKSTSGASLSLITAAAGVSIIIPSSIFSEYAMPSLSSSAFTELQISRIFSVSKTLVIIGNMIPRFP